jgi:hypothetical protein
VQCDVVPLVRAVRHQEDVPDLPRFERCAFNARFLEQCRCVQEARKLESGAYTQKCANLGGELLLVLDPGAIVRRRKRGNPRAT